MRLSRIISAWARNMPFDHFNFIAGFYDWAGKFTVTEPLFGFLALSPNSLVLDAGGGTGRVAAEIRGMVREVFVADISRGMLRRAAGKGLPAVCSPAESLPFLAGSFDRVIMVDALHHVLNQERTAHELWRAGLWRENCDRRTRYPQVCYQVDSHW